MSSFASPVTSPQQATLRASGYWARVLSVFNDNEVLWVAQAAEAKATPFITLAWDNESVGDYTDLVEGLVCYISASLDLRQAKYRGRVRLTPSSSQFYIDYNATLVSDGDYIIVVCDVDFMRRVRNDTLIDGSIAYHDLPPVLGEHPSTIVLYDADNDGTCSYTPIQYGIPVDAAATTVDTWSWSTLGGGTTNISDPTDEHPTFTFEAGYHYLLRVEFEDDNGVSNWHMAHVYAITRTFDAPVIQAVVAGSVNGDTDTGWTADLTAYGGVTALLNRNHCAVFAVEHFGDNSSVPLVSNVWIQGRVRSFTITTAGDETAGRVQESTFSVEGIAAYLQRERVPNDIVRPTASPNEWGEITDPNPYRMAVYEMWAYTTLTNICALSVDEDAFAAYQIGGEPRGIDGGQALDTLKSVLWDTIHAAPNFAPSGEIRLSRAAAYREDRSGLETIIVFGLQDTLDYSVDIDSSRTTAQVIAFGGVFDSSVNGFVLYTASAPSIPYGEGDIKEINREVLTADSTSVEASEEIGLRASNHYAFENSKPLMNLSLFDSHAGLLIPTNFQRYAAVLPASSNTSGIAYSATDYWQLQSVTLTINADGSVGVSGEWPRETAFEGSQTLANPAPINLTEVNPVLPVLPNDPAFPTDPLELYPTDTPALEDLQPINSDSAAQSYTPFPPDVAAQTAAAQGSPGCQTLQMLFKSSVNAQTSRVLTLSAPYIFSVRGITTYSTDEWQYTFNFLAEDGGFVRNPDPLIANNAYGNWVLMQGWLTNDALATGNYRRGIDIVLTGIASTEFTYFQIKYDYSGIAFVPPGSTAFVAQIGSNLLWNIADTVMPSGTDLYQAWTGSYTDTSFRIGINASVNNVNPTYGGSTRLKELTVRGKGHNPFDGSPAIVLDADAFYTFSRSDPSIQSSILGAGEGLFLNNSKYIPVPPYSDNHVYSNLPFAGTGNLLLGRMQFDSYSEKSNLYEYLEICRTS